MPHTMTPDGIGIAYQVRGEGAAAPLLLLAGQSNNHHWWDSVRDDFHGDRSTMTFDYRGTGASDKPDLPYSTELFALDAIAVLDALGVEGPTSTGPPWAGGSPSSSRRAIRTGYAPWCSGAHRPAARTPLNAPTTCAGPWRRRNRVRRGRPCWS